MLERLGSYPRANGLALALREINDRRPAGRHRRDCEAADKAPRYLGKSSVMFARSPQSGPPSGLFT